MEATKLDLKLMETTAGREDDKLRMTEEEFASFMNSVTPGRVVSIDLTEGSGQ